MVLRALHLCAGYGGFELALRGVARTVAHVERDAYAAATLVARMEESRLDRAPVWPDLCTFDAGPWRGRVDLVTAGFPCQPFSAAGKRAGTDDDRWLWPDIRRIIRDVRPSYCFLENVPGVVRHGLPHVLADLAALGFDAEWGLLSASAVGAPHKRERFWLVAHAAVGEWQPAGDERQIRVRATLVDKAKMWPSPRANDAIGGHETLEMRPRRKLKSVAVDWGTASHHAPTTPPDGPNGSGTAVLNPRFVEALMGLPPGWLTPSISAATDSCPSAPAPRGTNSSNDWGRREA